MFEDKLEERSKVNRNAMNDAISRMRELVGDDGVSSFEEGKDEAIKAILRYFNIKAKSLKPLNTDKDVETFLKINGLICQQIELTGEWWKNVTGPILVNDKNGNACSLLPTALGYRRYDRNRKKWVKVRAGNTSDLGTSGLNFYRSLHRRAMSIEEIYKFVLKNLSKGDIAIVLLFCLIPTVLGALVPVANKAMFNEVVPSGVAAGIIPICSLLLSASISKVIFDGCRDMLMLRLKDKVNACLQPALMFRLMLLPESFFKKHSAGDLSSRVLSVNNIYLIITYQVMSTVASALFATMYIFITFFYAKEMTWIVLLVILTLVVQDYFVIKSMVRHYNKIIPNKVLVQGFTHSAISGISKIKNNRAELRTFSQWVKRFEQSEFMSEKTPFLVKYKKVMGMAVTSLSTFLVYVFAYKYRISISNYVAFMSAFGIMITAFNDFTSLFAVVAKASPQLNLIKPIIETPIEIPEKAVDVPFISGSIEVNHVSFKYSENSPWVLDDVTLRINAGESIGLVGSSGCGKSTLMRILLGFEKATSGSVFYNQYNIDNVDIGSLRQFVGYCPQAMQIFPGTIADNIRFGASGCSEEELWEAARISCIDEDIRRTPNGMNTLLGEGGSGFSGGQCQRLLIARAVLNNPKVLFFDEATSALDNITQRKVTENLSKLNCTRISIAHRLSTIMDCDRIIALDRGRIIEEGSPKELMAKKGFFYTLSKRQQ